MFALTISLFHVLGLLSAFDAVMNNKTPQGTIAWGVSLVTFPYVAVPAYWVLGRSEFQGYVKAHQLDVEDLDEIAKSLNEKISHLRIDQDEMGSAAYAGEKLAGVPILRGNEVELLIDGEATFQNILDGIDKARDYILFQFYIIHDDEIGREIQSHLIAKAKEGVRINFLYDEIGSHKLPQSYIEELREAGVQIYPFHTQKGWSNRFQINFRNHRKIMVIDGEEAWVGGHNVGDEYLGKDPKFGHWRDTHIRIKGPSVLALQLSFLEDWHWAAGELPKVSWEPVVSESENIPVLIVASGPADEMETASLMFIQAINSARERIWIASPYFIPDAPVIAALQLARLHGVDVRILIPDMADHLGVYLAAYTYLDETEKSGIKFYRYLDGFLHEKVMLIDDTVSTVGTANFDNRSFRLNFEVTAVVIDQDFNEQVENMFEDDFQNSRLMQAGEFRDKPWWFRFAARLARLTSPIQ